MTPVIQGNAGSHKTWFGGRHSYLYSGVGRISTTLLHKVSPATKPSDLYAVLDALGPIKLVDINGDVVRRAVEARENYGVHLYDGMILATAERAAVRESGRRT